MAGVFTREPIFEVGTGSQSLNQALALPKEKPIVRSYNDLSVVIQSENLADLIPCVVRQDLTYKEQKISKDVFVFYHAQVYFTDHKIT